VSGDRLCTYQYVSGISSWNAYVLLLVQSQWR
jgi:hypothetical protein